MWLYKLTNKENLKAYIGTSVNPISKRVSRHLYAANCGRKDMAIACAIRQYGLDAFEIECIGESDDYDELLRMEAVAIKEHGSLAPAGYNITPGGRGARRPCSQQTRDRIAARKLGKHPWNFGKKTGPVSDEIRKKYSEARKGRKAWNKGIPHKPETLLKFKMRIPWNKGKKTGPMPDAIKEKIAAGVSAIRSRQFWSTRRSK